MSTTDLNILADAVTFAMLVAVGGVIVYAIARSTWKRHALRHTLKVGLSVAALFVVAIAGIAVWPAAREGVNTAAGVNLDEQGDVIVPEDEVEVQPPMRTSSTRRPRRGVRRGSARSRQSAPTARSTRPPRAAVQVAAAAVQAAVAAVQVVAVAVQVVAVAVQVVAVAVAVLVAAAVAVQVVAATPHPPRIPRRPGSLTLSGPLADPRPLADLRPSSGRSSDRSAARTGRLAGSGVPDAARPGRSSAP